jgi:hypothetical protein
MAKRPAPKGDGDGTADRESGRHEPKESLNEFFRCRPVRFCKHIAELAEREKTAKGKRDCYTEFIRYACTMIFFSWPFRIAGIVAFIALITYGIYLGGALTDDKGDLDPNGLIVLLTIALAFIAAVQWWVTYHQLETSRLDQRPWLSLESIHWDASDYQNDVLVIVAKNTGRSPAQKVSLDMAVTWAEPGTFDSEAYARNPANFERMFEGIVIPPGGVRSATLKNAYDCARPKFPTMTACELYLILRYQYTDLAHTPYGTGHCCYWNASAKIFPVYGPLARMY